MIECPSIIQVEAFGVFDPAIPVATDNVGIKTTVSSIPFGSVITADTLGVLTVTDFNSNIATCNITVKVLGEFLKPTCYYNLNP